MIGQAGTEALRVLLVCDFYRPVLGGMEGHVESLAAELQRQGHTVGIATLTRDAQSNDCREIFVVRSASRLLPHADPLRPFPVPVPDPLTNHDLASAIRVFRPDVIHGHSWLSVSIPRNGVPLVLTAHDYGLACHLRTLRHPGGGMCSGPGHAKCVRCAGPTEGTVKSLAMAEGTRLGRAWMTPKTIMTVSDAVRRQIEPYAACRTITVPNFVESTPAPPDTLPHLPAGPFVIYAGDPGIHKGLPRLLELWEGPEPVQADLVIASIRPVTRALPGNVTAMTLSRAQLAHALRQAALCVVPSLWADPAPTVVLESMREGTPVIGSRVGGIPEMVRDGSDGILVAPGDNTAMRNSLARMLSDELLRGRMARSATERARAYSADTLVPRIVEIYREARSRPTSPTRLVAR